MRLLPVFTETFRATWPPADVLRRVADKTASTQESILGGWLTTRTVNYHYIHLFSGTVSVDQFNIQRLSQPGGRGSLFEAGSALKPSLVGLVRAAPGGGTLLELRYQASAWWLPSIGLGFAGLFYQLLAAGELFGHALLQATGGAVVAWLLFQAFFWADARRWRADLMELLQLTPLSTPTPNRP